MVEKVYAWVREWPGDGHVRLLHILTEWNITYHVHVRKEMLSISDVGEMIFAKEEEPIVRKAEEGNPVLD